MKAKLEINGNKVEVEGSPAEIRGVLGFDSLCGHTAQEDPGKDELPKLSPAQKRAYVARRGAGRVAKYNLTTAGKRRKVINWVHFIGRPLKKEIQERYDNASGSEHERRNIVVDELAELAYSKGAGINAAGFSKSRLRRIIRCHITSAIGLIPPGGVASPGKTAPKNGGSE
ncbi:MAG: hypothetical protein PHS46_08230 [Candidatus Omnitrophica bacterium]|nr:hypothetical protein [Candidatus Omnitrophota bacterium]